MIVVGKSWVGRVRSRNEDVYWTRPEINLCGVADGMGGHDYGHVAARMTADAITDRMKETDLSTLDIDTLTRIIKDANIEIFNRARDLPDVNIMGSTLVMLQLVESSGFIAHAGDSRCYLLRDAELSQLTRDHNVVNDKIDAGELTPEEAAVSNIRNRVTQAIGPSMVVQPSIAVQEVKEGDLYILCSDGLSGFVEHEQLASLIKAHRNNLNLLLDKLINTASDSGSTDNITVVLAEIN